MIRLAALALCLMVSLLASSCATVRDPHDARYPAHWWDPVPREKAASWEILPQDCKPGEVILSKRHELGLLSNFAATPFTYRGVRYASVEGFWQMTKYPESDADPRAHLPGVTWPHTRAQVAAMVAFDAKRAGDVAEKIMERAAIDWVTFEGRRMRYREPARGEFYQLIRAAMREKVLANPEVRKALLSTGGLVLRPDHHEEPNAPPAWHYFETYMEFREQLRAGTF